MLRVELMQEFHCPHPSRGGKHLSKHLNFGQDLEPVQGTGRRHIWGKGTEPRGRAKG